MYAKRSWIFGSDSLLKFILLKRVMWKDVRKSYDELRWHKKQLEIILKEPLDSFSRENGCHIYSRIKDHWATIASLQLAFEQHLLAYKLTTPTKIEMVLYYEYLFHADMIMNICREWMTDVGIDTRPL